MFKSKKLIPVMAVVAALSVSACAKQQFVMQNGMGATAEDNMSIFFVSGIGQTHKVNAAQICNGSDKVMSVEAQQTFVNILLGVLTGGLVTPRQYRIKCRA